MTGQLPQRGGYRLCFSIPVAIVSLIVTNLGIKGLFKIDVEEEEANIERQHKSKKCDVMVYTVVVVNPLYFGKRRTPSPSY